MRIGIYGAGAVGGLIGGVLAHAGHEVGMVARGAHLAALRADGCTVETRGTRFTVQPNCAEDPEALGPQDVVFVAVKAPALAAAVAGVAPLLGPETAVVTAMNGIPWWFFDGFPRSGPAIRLPELDPDDRISRCIGGERIIGCVLHLGATVAAPGLVRHVADGRLILGEARGLQSRRLKALVEAFAPTTLQATATDDIRQEIWVKLLGNVNFNPITALTGATNRAVGADPAVRKICADMFEEIAAAGRKLGLEPGMSAEERIDIGASLGDFKTSMLQDFERGRRPEIDSIVGAAAAIGRAAGVPMPVTEAVLALVRLKAKTMGIG
jgi:2-dehydropantoate 2-reductase